MKRPIVILALAAALAAPAGLFVLTALPASSEEDSEAQQKAEWQQRYLNLRDQTDALRQQVEADTTAYQKGKQRGRLRGGAELKERIDENQRKLDDLERQLAEFPETARRAGVPPGWIREVQ